MGGLVALQLAIKEIGSYEAGGVWILLPFNAQKMVFISVFHILEIKTPGLSEEGR